MSARLGKAVQYVYRIVTFIEVIEMGFEIHEDYLQVYGHFPPNCTIDNTFVNNVELLFHQKYPYQFATNNRQPFKIKKENVLRAIDLISCNMRQFVMLFDASKAPRCSSIGRQILVLTSGHEQCTMAKPSSMECNNVTQSKRKFPLLKGGHSEK